MKATNILFSGGWGYGNLGDDAILDSTIRLIRQKYLHATIKVMSYDCCDTKKALQEAAIEIVPSIHRQLVGNLSQTKVNSIHDKSYLKIIGGNKLLSRIISKYRRTYMRNAEGLSFFKYLWYLRNLEAIRCYPDFMSADIFIMSGGAYLNSMWPDSIYAHALELIAADKNRIKTFLVGQSIGPFETERCRNAALTAIKKANIVSVRDQKSHDLLAQHGIKSTIVPDIALAEIEFDFVKLPEIAVIVNDDLDYGALQTAYKSIVNVCRNSNLTVKVLVTRLWWPDIKRAETFFKNLQEDNLKAKMIVPDNYKTLQNEIGICKTVVSPNLHGLVMGWRAGVPCVALQRHGKYLAFMEQTHQANRAFAPNQTNEIILTKGIYDALNTSDNFTESRNTISKAITNNFNNLLDSL